MTEKFIMGSMSYFNKGEWFKALVYGVLLVGMYYSTFTWLAIVDWGRDDYSYGYIIPLVAVYLI